MIIIIIIIIITIIIIIIIIIIITIIVIIYFFSSQVYVNVKYANQVANCNSPTQVERFTIVDVTK